MKKMLCWEECLDGRYCKNYRLKNKSKCRLHYNNEDESNSLYYIAFLIVLSYFVVFGAVFHKHHSNDMDIFINKLVDYSNYNVSVEYLNMRFTEYVEYLYKYI